jgi:hypothetical protein
MSTLVDVPEKYEQQEGAIRHGYSANGIGIREAHLPVIQPRAYGLALAA